MTDGAVVIHKLKKLTTIFNENVIIILSIPKLTKPFYKNNVEIKFGNYNKILMFTHIVLFTRTLMTWIKNFISILELLRNLINKKSFLCNMMIQTAV